MDIETSAANTDAVVDAAPEGVAAPDTSAEDNAQTTEPVIEADPAPQEEPDISKTQAFSKRLNEMVAAREQAQTEKFNNLVAQLGGTKPDGTPIQTVADLESALEYQKMQAEAEKQAIPVELYSRLTQAEKDALEAKNMLSEYQRKDALTKEAETLATDEKWGEFYKANEADIKATADKLGCDLSTAKLIVYDKIGPAKIDEKAIAEKAIQEYIEGKRGDYKPVEGSGAAPVQTVTTPKTFTEAREGALAILRASRQT